MTAVNVLEQRLYKHHPVMQHVTPLVFPLERDFMLELHGLRVPTEYDCDNLNSYQPTPLGHQYYFEVPSRWRACHAHEAAVRSGALTFAPALPVVDEEYYEHVAVYHAVLRAVRLFHRSPANSPRKFVFAELGARWGTWAARAAAMARVLAPEMPCELYVVESNPINCDALRRVMAVNNLQYRLDCARANSTSLRRWAEGVDHIDAVDMDIQGAEYSYGMGKTSATIFGSAALRSVMSQKVLRVIVGTHFPARHHHIPLRALLSDAKAMGWQQIFALPPDQRIVDCLIRVLRGSYNYTSPERFDWTQMLRLKCFQRGPFGPVANFDGQLIFDNPRFLVNSSTAFRMNNTELIVDDVLLSPQDR